MVPYVQPLKQKYHMENKVLKLLPREKEKKREIVTDIIEVFQRLGRGWEVLEVLDCDRFLMGKNENKKINSSRARERRLISGPGS